MKLDPDLGLFAALPDAVKRQIHHHLAKGNISCAAPLDTRALRSYRLCLSDRFLAIDACRAAKEEADKLLKSSGRQAGMGGMTPDVNAAFRGDRACFLQPNQTDYPALRTASDAVLALQIELATAGYDVSGTPSIQLSCYPGKGTSYGGGPGYLHGEAATVIAPMGGRLVLFDSCMHHEVLASHKCRYALTVWFRKGQGAGVQLEADEELPQHGKCQPACAQSAAADSTSSSQQEKGHRAGAQCAAADAASSTPYTAPPAAEHQSSSSERIFVSIAAFRDSETRWTVRDLLSKASQHDRLRIAVVWQLDAASQADLTDLQIPASQKRLVREIRLDYREATGPCKARTLAQKLWAGEEYYLQLDAHMRFTPGWDEDLIQWLHGIESERPGSKPVLSTYPPGYEGQGPDAEVPADDRPTLLRASHFGPEGMLRLKASRLARCAEAPIPSLFWAAGFSFSRSELLTKVPYQDLPFLFFGEEQAMLARMWTHGFDMYAPPRSIAWHQWSRAGRNTFSQCIPQDSALKAKSQEQVLQLFSAGACNGQIPDNEAQNGGFSLGLGSARTIADIQETVGVDYRRMQISAAAMRGSRGADVEYASDNSQTDLAPHLALVLQCKQP